ncbi:MAG: GNAT family N-acetyltransferase, partial [Candidatus Omnitrophota bacterium]
MNLYNEFKEQFADMEIDRFLSTFQGNFYEDNGQQIDETAQQAIRAYAGTERAQRKDYQRLNVFDIVSAFLNGRNRDTLEEPYHQYIWQALLAEANNKFTDFRYDSRDYIQFLENFALSLLSDAQKKNLAPSEGESALRKIEEKAHNDPSLQKVLQTVKAFDQAWRQNLVYDVVIDGEPFTIEIIDDFFGLLNIGNTNPRHFSSCQNPMGSRALNRSLLGYLMNGSNKAIVLRNMRGEVVTRRIIKLHLAMDRNNNLNPVVFVEESTQYNSKGVDQIYRVLEILGYKMSNLGEGSKSLNIPVLKPGVAMTDAAYTLMLYAGRWPYSYSDNYGNSFYGTETLGITTTIAGQFYQEKDATVKVTARPLYAEHKPEEIEGKFGLRLHKDNVQPDRISPQTEDRVYIVTSSVPQDTARVVAAIKSINNAIGWASNNRLIEKLLSAAHRNSSVTYAEVDGQIIGYVLATRQTKDETKMPFIAVLPEWRGKGIAAQLLEQMFREEKSRGVKNVTGHVRENNKAAIRLYEGFRNQYPFKTWIDKDDARYKNEDTKLNFSFDLTRAAVSIVPVASVSAQKDGGLDDIVDVRPEYGALVIERRSGMPEKAHEAWLTRVRYVDYPLVKYKNLILVTTPDSAVEGDDEMIVGLTKLAVKALIPKKMIRQESDWRDILNDRTDDKSIMESSIVILNNNKVYFMEKGSLNSRVFDREQQAQAEKAARQFISSPVLESGARDKDAWRRTNEAGGFFYSVSKDIDGKVRGIQSHLDSFGNAKDGGISDLLKKSEEQLKKLREERNRINNPERASSRIDQLAILNGRIVDLEKERQRLQIQYWQAAVDEYYKALRSALSLQLEAAQDQAVIAYTTFMRKMSDALGEDFTYIYPFMGPDIVPALFRKTYHININIEDFARGGKIIVKALNSHDAAAAPQTNILGIETARDVKNEADSYLRELAS